MSLGASAEYGNVLGGVVNVVTKSGGNQFRFDAAYFGQPDRFTSRPIKDCGCAQARRAIDGTDVDSQPTSAVRLSRTRRGSSAAAKSSATTTTSRAPIRSSRSPARTRNSSAK